MGLVSVDGFFVVVLSRGNVLLGNSVPSKSKAEAERSLLEFPEDVRNKSETNIAFDAQVAQLLVNLMNDPKGSWKDAGKINLDTTSKVLLELRKTEPGTVLSYGDLAKLALNNEKAARSVGTAMKRNLWPLLVPCHRVVKSDGSLGRYSGCGGEETKRELLRKEGANIATKKRKLIK
jgi:O-6-methylguanine DNA methyltransferase